MRDRKFALSDIWVNPKFFTNKILQLGKKKKNPWKQAQRVLLEILKIDNLIGNNFHETSVYNYTITVVASFHYWAE